MNKMIEPSHYQIK